MNAYFMGNKYEKLSNIIKGNTILRIYRHSELMGKMLLNIKERLLKRKVYNDYKYVFDKYANSESGEMIGNDTPVWVFWWQGKEQMPLMVAKCIERIKVAFPERTFHLITKDNYKSFVDIGNHIVQKLKEEKITVTFFSDVLRVNLLAKHGGVWCDATLWFDGTPQFDLENKYFFSLKHQPNKPQVKMEPSRAYWRAFFMITGKDNIIMKCTADFFEEYFKENDTIFDYFFVDYALRLCYEHLPAAKEMMDSVPEIEPIIYDLYDKLNTAFHEDEYHSLMSRYPIQKLNRRGTFLETTDDGQETFYYNLIVKHDKTV